MTPEQEQQRASLEWEVIVAVLGVRDRLLSDAEARAAISIIVRRCAEAAEKAPLVGVLAPGWADGASSASRQITAAIRALAGEG